MGEMPSPNVVGPLSVFQVLNMGYGVSVLGGPLSVMILSATHIWSLYGTCGRWQTEQVQVFKTELIKFVFLQKRCEVS